MLADLEAVARRLRADGRFYRLVLEWPDELCRMYALSSDEVDALQAGDAQALRRLGLEPAEAAAVARTIRPLSTRVVRRLTYSRREQFRQAYSSIL